MITVAILINGNPLMARSARRIEPGVYRCDDGTIIKHMYEDGALPLAHKLLDTIKESTPEPQDNKEKV